MFAILEALENAIKKTLCFRSIEDAERFKSFVNTYMEESGAGNGYGAYWVNFNAKIVQVLEILDSFTTEINDNYIESMMESIIAERLAGLDQDYKTGGIIFSVSPLPPRQRPKAGDMFRTLISMGAEKKMEGRVLKDLGDTFEVIGYFDEGEDGKPKVDAKVITIDADKVMKIHDWLTKES